MRIQNKTINDCEVPVLEVTILDDEDIADIQLNYFKCKNVQIELSSLQYLSLFSEINVLIITGGMATPEGLMCLYGLKELETLVLDFEETDSDEDGIHLERFPKLHYVLSCSDLNIYHYNELNTQNIRIEVINFYGQGRPKKIQPVFSSNLYAKRKFLFFSAEAQSPTSVMIIQLLRPIENAFDAEFGKLVFSESLDSIGIIPICRPESDLLHFVIKERKYVSLKRRYADIRIRIPFEEFVSGDRTKRIILCKENIACAVRYISRKDKSFASDEFLKIIDVLFQKIYRI